MLSRSTLVLDAWTDLMARSVALLQAGERYVSLVNARAEWLFKRDDSNLRGLDGAWVGVLESRRLDLVLRTGAVMGWDVEYWRAREVVEGSLGEFLEGLEGGEGGRFMRLAKVLCPSGEGREALEEWFEGTVGELVDVAPAWLEGGFTLRETLREVAERHGEVRILVDCLDGADGEVGVVIAGRRARGNLRLQRRQVYDLRHGSLTPLCKLVWVTESLANRIANMDEGTGPVA